ncbi:unnamed protein product, partial [Ectocarpus fasciculatus]
MGDSVAMDNGEVKVDSQQQQAEAQQLQQQQQPESSTAEEAPQVGAPADAASTTTPASPVLVFLNSASGGKMGPKVLEKIRVLIPESQLFDLQEVGQGRWKPEDKLKLFQHTKDTKVLICGGDGTMGWILSCIDRLRMAAEPSPSLSEENFPVAMMPLGTGNDLARTFGWGPGFTRAMLKPKFLDRVKEAPAARLDRWLLSVMPYEPLGSEEKVKSTKIPPTFSLHRYASAIGGPMGEGEDLAGAGMNDASEHKRTQSVLRMGRSFSVKMSSQ